MAKPDLHASPLARGVWLLAAVALVVLAGVTSSGTLWRHAGGSPLVDVSPARLVGLSLLAAAAVAVAYVVATAGITSWRDGWRSLALLLALIGAWVYLLWLVPLHRAQTLPPQRPAKPRALAPTRPARAQHVRPFRHVAPWWWIAALLGAGGALAAWELVRRRAAALPLAPEPEAEPAADDVLAAVDVSLEEIEREPDPRLAVIKAYVRLETTLAEAGLPRRRVETSREHVLRALAALRVRRPPVERLTRLFHEARFSVHHVEPSMKTDAIAALRAIRAELESGR